MKIKFLQLISILLLSGIFYSCGLEEQEKKIKENASLSIVKGKDTLLIGSWRIDTMTIIKAIPKNQLKSLKENIKLMQDSVRYVFYTNHIFDRYLGKRLIGRGQWQLSKDEKHIKIRQNVKDEFTMTPLEKLDKNAFIIVDGNTKILFKK